MLTKIIGTMSADYWEQFLQARRIPAARIRRLEEAIADEQVACRQVLQQHANSGSAVDGLRVPVAAFNLSDSPPTLTLAPQPMGAQSAEILAELGYAQQEIDAMRAAGVVN